MKFDEAGIRVPESELITDNDNNIFGVGDVSRSLLAILPETRYDNNRLFRATTFFIPQDFELA